MRQLTKQQILERFAGTNHARALVRLSLLGRQPKVLRTEEMVISLEWSKEGAHEHHLRAIAPMDRDWSEGDEDSMTEEGNIVVGNQLMQLFAPDGAGAVLEKSERVGEQYVYRVGELYSPNRTVWPEAGEYNFRKDTHELRLFFAGLTAQDIEAIRRGSARFGLLIEQDIIFLLYDFGTACPLSDAPYTIHMVPHNERTLPPDPATTLAPHEGVALNVVLVHAENGRIAAIRLIGLGHDFSVALLAAIRRQASLPFSQTTYDRHLMDAYQRYPHAQKMWPHALHFAIPGR